MIAIDDMAQIMAVFNMAQRRENEGVSHLSKSSFRLSVEWQYFSVTIDISRQ